MPVTNAGRILAGITSILGFSLLFFPIVIFVKVFEQHEKQKEDFIQIFKSIAKIPFLKKASAEEIVDFIDKLKPLFVPAGSNITSKANEIYFLSEGLIEIRTKNNVINLKKCDSFGLSLENDVDNQTITTLTDCSLLVFNCKQK